MARWDDYPDAEPAKSGWDQYPDAEGDKRPSTWGETAIDVAKTAPSALARGVAALPGLPGNLQSLVRSGIDYVLPPSEKQLAARAEAPNLLPTGRAIEQSVIEPVTGPLYEPQTRTGKFVGAGVEAIPSMALGGP